MTITNVIAGFRCTGMYPFNRTAIPPLSPSRSGSKRTSLSEKTGLKFIPLFTPVRNDRPADCPASPRFTEDEMSAFAHKFDEARYVKWLDKYHPEVARNNDQINTEDGANTTRNTLCNTVDIICDTSQNSRSPTPLNIKEKLSFDDETQSTQLKRQTVLSKTLSTVSNTSILPLLQKNGRLLTSAENNKDD